MDMDRNTCYPNPFFNKGALYVGNGRYALPMPTLNEDKKHSKAAIIASSVVTAVVLLGVIVMSIWLGSSRAPDGKLPFSQTLSTSLGMTQSQVAEALELQEGLKPVAPGVFAIPGGCEHKGITYTVQLHFDENEQLLCGYEYIASYKADEKTAASDILKAKKYYVASDKSRIKGEALEISESDLAAQLSSGKVFESSDAWNVSRSDLIYLQYLEKQPYWEGRVGEYLTKNAHLYKDLDLKYDLATQNMSIQLRYVVEADRSK